MRRIDVHERRARLGLRHRLAASARADTPVQVANSLVALHATDPASVHLAAMARMREPSIAAIERSLYDERSLVRMLGMRRTMFVVPTELAPVVQEACTREIAARQRRLYADLFGRAGFTDDIDAWLVDVEASTLRALKARGEATATQLAEDEPRLRQQVLLAEGKAYGRSRTCRRACCSCSPPTARSCVADRAGRGSAASIGGRRLRCGSPVGCPTSRRLTRRSNWCAAGWRRLGPAHGVTCSGGPG